MSCRYRIDDNGEKRNLIWKRLESIPILSAVLPGGASVVGKGHETGGTVRGFRQWFLETSHAI